MISPASNGCNCLCTVHVCFGEPLWAAVEDAPATTNEGLGRGLHDPSLFASFVKLNLALPMENKLPEPACEEIVDLVCKIQERQFIDGQGMAADVGSGGTTASSACSDLFPVVAARTAGLDISLDAQPANDLREAKGRHGKKKGASSNAPVFDDYLQFTSTLGTLRTVSMQMLDDIPNSSHKYIAHQMAILYVGIGFQVVKLFCVEVFIDFVAIPVALLSPS